MDAFETLQKYYGGDTAMIGKVTPTIRTDPDHVVEDTEIVQRKKNTEAKEAEKAIETLQKHYLTKYMSGGTVNSKTVFNARTPSDTVVHNTEVKRTKPNMDNMEKNVQAKEAEEAIETAIDHGFDPDSPEGQKKIQQLLAGIRQKNQEASTTKNVENFEKARPRENKSPYLRQDRGNYPTSDPENAKMAWGIVFREDPGLKGDVREEAKADWRPGMGPKPRGSRAWAKFSKIFERLKAKGGKKGEDSEKAIINMEKAHVSPQLARLLSAAAGWALSGDIAGKVDPHLAQEWDRASSMHDKRKLQEEMMRQMHRMSRKPQAKLEVYRKPQPKLLIIQRKSDDGNFLENAPAFDNLHMFYKKEEDNIFAYGGDTDDIPYDDTEDEEDPQWEGWAKEGGKHDAATQEGWGGKEHDIEDFHPESGQLTVPGQGAHDVKEWAKGVQEQTGVPLVGGPTGNEPHDDINQHYGIQGHMSGTPITPQHIADYVQNKTGQSVSMPGTQAPPVQQMLKYLFMKDHAPIPPRQGLLWDAVKHRWTRPEKVGKTVWEVQGHKRFRGTGAGAHERSRKVGGSGGYGVGSSEAGRRFRSVGDVGRAHPHEAKRPGQRDLKSFKRVTQPKRR